MKTHGEAGTWESGCVANARSADGYQARNKQGPPPARLIDPGAGSGRFSVAGGRAFVELSLEKSRARAERAAKALRELDADRHLVEAVERAQEELSAAARRLRQGTYFAVPDAQVDIEVT